MRAMFVVEDPDRNLRYEVDLPNRASVEIVEEYFHQHGYLRMATRETGGSIPACAPRTWLSFAANRIINTKTDELVKNLPSKTRRRA